MLGEQFGIVFDHLIALAAMPNKRYGSWRISKGRFDDYMRTLRSAQREENVDGVVCRDLAGVDWRGNPYDCDFNQVLDLPAESIGDHRPHLRDLLRGRLPRPIAVARHCFGCTAGQGSRCDGALVA